MITTTSAKPCSALTPHASPTPVPTAPRDARPYADGMGANSTGVPQRGDIWMVTTNPATPPVGSETWSDRPGIIISNNTLNRHAGFAMVVYLTRSTNKRSSPTHVPVLSPTRRQGDTTSMSLAMCEQVHTVDASRLSHRMNVLDSNDMASVDAAVTIALALGRAPAYHSIFRKWEAHLNQYGIEMATAITALSGATADERVQSLSNALAIVTNERDALRTLQNTGSHLDAALTQVNKAMAAHHNKELEALQ